MTFSLKHFFSRLLRLFFICSYVKLASLFHKIELFLSMWTRSNWDLNIGEPVPIDVSFIIESANLSLSILLLFFFVKSGYKTFVSRCLLQFVGAMPISEHPRRLPLIECTCDGEAEIPWSWLHNQNLYTFVWNCLKFGQTQRWQWFHSQWSLFHNVKFDWWFVLCTRSGRQLQKLIRTKVFLLRYGIARNIAWRCKLLRLIIFWLLNWGSQTSCSPCKFGFWRCLTDWEPLRDISQWTYEVSTCNGSH